MAIPRVWPSGISSMPVDAKGRRVFSFSDAATLDAHEQRGADKQVAGGVLAGTLAVSGTGAVSLDDPNAQLILSGVNATTATGGRIRCGDTDFPQFSAPRDRTPFFPFHEAYPNFGGGHALRTGGFSLQNVPGGIAIPAGVTPSFGWYVDVGTEGLTPGTATTGTASGLLVVPLTRVHDGAELLSVTVYFSVSTFRTQLPTRFPGVAIYKMDPFLGTTTMISGAWQYFPTPANLAAYKNGAHGGIGGHWDGTPNAIPVALTEPIDVENFVYTLVLLDESYDGETLNQTLMNLFQGFSMESEATSLRFQ